MVTRTYHIEGGGSGFGHGPVLVTTAIRSQGLICEADDSTVTGLSFIEPHHMKVSFDNTLLGSDTKLRTTQPVVVILRPGVVQLWVEECEGSAWSGLRSLSLQRQGISSGSSMFYSPSGLVYSPVHDTLVVSLTDGSFHVIYGISSSPTSELPLGLTKQPSFSSSDLSLISRKVFIQVEGSAIPHVEMNRINGMVAFGGFPIVSWAHEGSMPSDFSYKHEATHNSTLVVAGIHAEDDDNAILEMLTDIISTTKAFPMTVPIHILRPILFRLVQGGVLTRLHSRLLQTLQKVAADDALGFAAPHLLFDPSTSPYASFRESIVRQLFQNGALLRLRLKLAITDFCWRSTSTPENKNEYGAVAQDLLRAISHRVLGTLVQHISLVANVLTRDDLAFVLRVVVQCMLPGTPQELSSEAQILTNKVTTSFPLVEHERASGGILELCPACGVEVPLTDIAVATCSNGHRWSRCSVTSFILSTTKVKTCIGCARKAFLPAVRSTYQKGWGDVQIRGVEDSERTLAEGPSTVEEPGTENAGTTGRGWVVQELLKAVRRCLFCGNNFAILI